ncbi:MAG: DUF4405 domain-containing protein [Gallionellaceae bacterium]|nr:DUF4405 domain-containing protein [Gallionellaceae bacterium]
MNVNREWATPITMGAFMLSAVTGVLIFFHLDSGFNKFVHEWLSWVLLAGVVLHVAANFNGFRRHLDSRKGKILLGTFAVLLALSFLPAADRSEPSFLAPVRALAQAPIDTLAAVARVSPEKMRERLLARGLAPASGQDSLNDLIGADPRRQAEELRALLVAE